MIFKRNIVSVTEAIQAAPTKLGCISLDFLKGSICFLNCDDLSPGKSLLIGSPSFCLDYSKVFFSSIQ